MKYGFEIFCRSQKKYMITSLYLMFDLDMILIVNVYKVFKLVMPMSKYQVFTIKETEYTFFNDRG